jgi:predicted DNA-binding transcriptional regulator AlpA
MLTSTKPGLPGKFLRKKEVCAITSLSSTQLQEEVKAGRFEKPTRLTENSNILVWWEPNVLAWVERRLKARGGPVDRARAEKCEARARNAAAHRRIAKRAETGVRR